MSLAYMPLFVDRYEADTAHLTVEEDGAYSRLLRLCWRTPGGTIPDDHEWIRRRMRVDLETYDRLVRPILSEFFSVSRGRFCQKRLVEIYEETAGKISAKSKAGKLGGLAKAAKSKEMTASTGTDLPLANSKQTPGNIEPEPEPEEIPPNPLKGDAQMSLIPEDPPKAKRRQQFPEDWTPSERLTLWAVGEGLDRARVLRCAAACVNHHRAKGTTFADLDAAFRTWVHNEVSRFGAVAKPAPATSATSDDSAFMRRIANRMGSQK